MSPKTELRDNWRLVTGSFVGVMLGVWAIPIYALGPMAATFRAEFGWTTASILTSASFLSAGIAIGSPLVGRIADSVQPRTVASTSMALMAACFASLAWLDGPIWHLYLLFFLIGILGAGSGGLVFTRAIGTQFHSARGIALGIALSGSGVASFFTPLLVEAVRSALGWRVIGFAIAALIVVVGLPIVHIGLRGATPRSGHDEAEISEVAGAGMTRAEALKDPRFYLLILPICIFGLFISSLIVNIVPGLVERGVTAARAAQAASVLGIAIIVGRLLVGWALDRWTACHVGAATFALGSIGALVLAFGNTDIAIVAIFSLGFLLGAEIDLMSFMTLKFFGVRHFGQIYGVLISLYMLTNVAGPLIMFRIVDIGGQFVLYAAAAGGFAVSAMLMMALARFPGGAPTSSR